MRLIQIVPRTQAGDGVADYSVALARSLDEHCGVASEFVEAGVAAGPGALTARLRAPEAGTGLLLHYVGYGYSKRGAPLWLARALDNRGSGPRLGVVFHELYATGRPWQSSFWLSGVQRHVASRMARACEFALITREASRQWLERGGGLAGKPVTVLPISSNVGEPRVVRAPGDRPPAMVVWGSANARSQLYSEHAPRLAAACRSLGLSRIVDIGPPVAPAAIAGVPIESRGHLPAPALSAELLDARCGVVVYPASFLAKSSIFGAYAAHGLVPLVLDEPRTAPLDALEAGRHFLRLVPGGVEGATALDTIANGARTWYAGHTTAAHAEAVSRMLMRGRA